MHYRSLSFLFLVFVCAVLPLFAAPHPGINSSKHKIVADSDPYPHLHAPDPDPGAHIHAPDPDSDVHLPAPLPDDFIRTHFEYRPDPAPKTRDLTTIHESNPYKWLSRQDALSELDDLLVLLTKPLSSDELSYDSIKSQREREVGVLKLSAVEYEIEELKAVHGGSVHLFL